LELIKDPRAARKDVVLRCQRAGVSISPDVVDAIFEQYELDKKRAP
jgi:F420-dependent methylenetetrahydromethanopterin dehydrogenase